VIASGCVSALVLRRTARFAGLLRMSATKEFFERALMVEFFARVHELLGSSESFGEQFGINR
jgi:hypothetical protein